MNKVILTGGRLTKDVELKQTSNGVNYTRFVIAVNRRYDREKADFISCVAWRGTAEFIEKYFKKGSQINVVGEIQTDSYEKDGQRYFTSDVVVSEVEFGGSKASNGTETTSSDNNPSGFKAVEDTDDDLPF